MAVQNTFRRTLVLSTFIFSIVLTSCSSEESETALGEVVTEELTPQLRFERNCAACHGCNGKLGVGGAFDLTESTLDASEIENVIRNGRLGMPPQGQAFESDQELKDLTDYVISLREAE